MSTKVKGEAIKEKSILFNALSDEITDCMIPVVGTTSQSKLTKFIELLKTNTDFSCIIEFPDICIIGKAILQEENYQIEGVVYSGDYDCIGSPIVITEDNGKLIDSVSLNSTLIGGEIYYEFIESDDEDGESSIDDPIVLKYLLNPLVLSTNTKVPNELIEDEQLKYLYRGMYSDVVYLNRHEDDDIGYHDEMSQVVDITGDYVKCKLGDLTLINENGEYYLEAQFG